MLRLEEVHSYYGDSHVVQGVSLAVERGETVALVGRNGAGKTTLLKTIMGIVPARRGRVRLDGADVTGLPTHEIARRGITLVPEDRRIFPGSRWRRTCAWPSWRTGRGRRRRSSRVLEYFPRLARAPRPGGPEPLRRRAADAGARARVPRPAPRSC